MSTVKSKVTYNAMGEKVNIKKSMNSSIAGNLPDVNVYGNCDKLRRKWNKTVTSKVDASTNIKKFPRTILKNIPEEFKKLIYKNIEFPNLWSPNDENWFDMRRTMRIARTILEMR
jgi:hypothetical protein